MVMDYLSIVKSDKNRGYASISLKIGLVEKDLPMLQKIRRVLNIGRINGPYQKLRTPVVYLVLIEQSYNKYYSFYSLYHKISF